MSQRKAAPEGTKTRISSIRTRIAQVVWLVFVVCALFLAVGALLIALDANRNNSLVDFVLSAADYIDLDIFSRKVVHVEVHNHEREVLAKDFITAAVAANGGIVPDYVHSDNGSPMIGKTVTQLLCDLHITASTSRPHVSNDNPYSEAWNKTLKYAPVFPENFGSLTQARDFLARFVDYYNHEHRHSQIGLHTPASVHDGSWVIIRRRRQRVLDHAYQAHPERFRKHHPTAPQPPKEAWINRPSITTEPHTAKPA